MKFLPLVLAPLLLVSCATKSDRMEVQEKVAKETVQDGRSLGQDIDKVISDSTTLNEVQKNELNRVLGEVRGKNRALMQESFKLRAVLIKELLSQNFNQKQIKLIKKQIKKNESERLRNSLAAIDKISIIVRKDPEGQMILDHMFYTDRPFR